LIGINPIGLEGLVNYSLTCLQLRLLVTDSDRFPSLYINAFSAFDIAGKVTESTSGLSNSCTSDPRNLFGKPFGIEPTCSDLWKK